MAGHSVPGVVILIYPEMVKRGCHFQQSRTRAQRWCLHISSSYIT